MQNKTPNNINVLQGPKQPMQTLVGRSPCPIALKSKLIGLTRSRRPRALTVWGGFSHLAPPTDANARSRFPSPQQWESSFCSLKPACSNHGMRSKTPADRSPDLTSGEEYEGNNCYPNHTYLHHPLPDSFLFPSRLLRTEVVLHPHHPANRSPRHHAIIVTCIPIHQERPLPFMYHRNSQPIVQYLLTPSNLPLILPLIPTPTSRFRGGHTPRCCCQVLRFDRVWPCLRSRDVVSIGWDLLLRSKLSLLVC